MLRLIRRHTKSCQYTSSRYRRCGCPIHVYGTLGGEKVRQALDLTSWEAASDLVAAWTASGQVGVIRPDIPAIKEAIEKFIAYAKAKNRTWETLRKYENLLERRFLPWCESRGYRLLKQLSVDALRTFQATWDDSPRYAAKNIERLRSLFRFCHQADWIKTNPALALEAPTSKPTPTLPFSADEMKTILDACDRYRGDRKRMKAFILVMRYSGLRIGDTITLRRDRLNGNKLFLYTQKTGTPVYVPLSQVVVNALNELPNGKEHYFWTGKNRRSAVSNWSRYLESIFTLAKVKDAHSHRFRDTFAVSLLEKGISIESVSVLLGHSSIRITERHYKPWVQTLQTKLEEEVAKTW